jgi:mono/diheme cytochrome c family protein
MKWRTEMKNSLFVPAIVALFLAAPCFAQGDQNNAASLRAGRAIATSTCIVCHVLSPDQAIKPLYGGKAPSFEELANRPETSRTSLLAFLNSPHWNDPALPKKPAPMVLMSERDKSNVTAYILSLRRPQ